MTLTLDSALPDELLLQITDNLSFPELLVSSHVCQRLRQVAQASDVFWQIVSAHSVSSAHLAMLKRRIAAGLGRPFELHLHFPQILAPEEQTEISVVLNTSTVARLTSFTLHGDGETMECLMQHLRAAPAPLLEDLELSMATYDGNFPTAELPPDIFASQAQNLQSAALRRVAILDSHLPAFDQLCTLKYELVRGAVPLGMLTHARKLRTLELSGWLLWLPSNMTPESHSFTATLTHLHVSVLSHQYGPLGWLPQLDRIPAISFMPEPSADFARALVHHLSGPIRISIRDERRSVCSIKFEEMHTGRWRRIGYAKVARSDASRRQFGNTIRDTYFADATLQLPDRTLALSLTVKTAWAAEFLPQLPCCAELALLVERTNDTAKPNAEVNSSLDVPILHTINISSRRAKESLNAEVLVSILSQLLSLPLVDAVRPQLWIRQISLCGNTMKLGANFDLHYAGPL